MLCLAAILYGCGRTGVSYEKNPVTATVAGKVMEVQDYVGSTLKFIEGDISELFIKGRDELPDREAVLPRDGCLCDRAVHICQAEFGGNGFR